MRKLRLLASVSLVLAPVMGAARYLIEPARADAIHSSTYSQFYPSIPGFTVESIALGLLLGLLLIVLVGHRGFDWIKTRIGPPIFRAP